LFSGDTASVEITGGVPNEMEEGSYEVLLHFANPAEKLRDRSDYSIRLANEDVWEAKQDTILFYTKLK